MGTTFGAAWVGTRAFVSVAYDLDANELTLYYAKGPDDVQSVVLDSYYDRRVLMPVAITANPLVGPEHVRIFVGEWATNIRLFEVNLGSMQVETEDISL